MIKNLPITVRIDSDIPKSATVGKPTPEFVINAAVPVNADVTKGLGKIGVKTLEGTVRAKARVAAPEGDIDVTVPVVVNRTTVPASGPFSVTSAGAAPALTFRQPGSAKITVGDLAARITLKDADGDVTWPGTIDALCTLDAGQNDVLASLRITGSRSTTGPVGSGTTDPVTSGSSAAGETASHTTAHKPKGSLAVTGADGTPWLLGGAGALVAAGASAIFAARRSRTRDGGSARVAS